MKSNKELLEDSLAHVKLVFESNDTGHLHYHNLAHTLSVYEQTSKIVNSEKSISADERLCLQLAAIFHDAAYYQGCESHEANSAALANEFLTKEGMDASKISLIEKLILATQMGYQPKDLNEQIMQDADFSHLGSSTYFETQYLGLLLEINEEKDPPFTDDQWLQVCISFFEKQVYHTDYAKNHLEKQKAINLERLKNMNESVEKVESKKKKSSSKKDKRSKEEMKENKPRSAEKGIETMFRVSLRNHLSLSRIADNKANTLISVNAIIISIVLSAMFPKMDTNPYLIYPGIALLIFSIVTIIISILSTIPKTTHGQLTRKEVEEKKGNLLFFGNFHKMSLNDYEWGIEELMKDGDYLYKTLSRDLYFLGKVLNRKYVLLRYSYYTFVIGLSLSIVLFLLSLREIMV
jgi:predicted metal-dependent HD superfamily phosphohydrolase